MEGNVSLRGHYRIDRYDRSSGRSLGCLEVPNAVTKSLFLDLGIGASADHLDSATDLRIKAAGGATVKTLSSQAAGYPSHGVAAQVDLRWEDTTADTYDAHTLEIVTSGGLVFSTAAPAFGTKPAGENWVFRYTLSFGAGTSALSIEGRDLWLRLVTGNSASHFTNSSKLRVTGGSAVTFETADELAPAGGIAANSVSRTAEGTVRFTFVAGDNVLEGTWNRVVIENPGGTTSAWWLREGLTSVSSKADKIERTFHYDLSV